MLFISVLIPVLTLVLPFICCGLKHGHVTVLGRIIWIGDDDSIFQQTRLANLCRRNDHLMQGRAGSLTNQCIKTLSRCTHSDDNWDGRKVLLIAALDKTLHDGRCCSGLASLHTAVCLINNEIQTVSFFSCCIFNGLPNRILSRIRMTAQITGLAKLLRI